MRLLFVVLGTVCFAVGVVGIFVPLLPTTPFMLLAAFCWARGSERLHRWLIRHPRYGKPLLDWFDHGVIRPRAKVVSVVLIVLSLSWPIAFLDLHPLAKAAAGVTGAAVITFLLTRPSRPPDAPRALPGCR